MVERPTQGLSLAAKEWLGTDKGEYGAGGYEEYGAGGYEEALGETALRRSTPQLTMSTAEIPISTAEIPISTAEMIEEPTAGWFNEWRERLDAWWALLPYRDQLRLGECMGALALHLVSRLDAALRSWHALLLGGGLGGGALPHGGGEPAVGAAGRLAPGSKCERLLDPPREERSTLELPPFPELPAQFRVPPHLMLPRLLLPWSGGGELLVDGELSREARQPREAANFTRGMRVAVGVGIGAASAGLLVLVAAQRRLCGHVKILQSS